MTVEPLLSQDVYFLLKRFRLLQRSIINAVSNNTNSISEPDMKRITDYIKAIKDLKAWIMGQPLLDLPKTSPIVYKLSEPVVVPEMENLDAMILLELMRTADLEMRNSVSSRQTTGIVSHDSVRFDSIILKAEKFLVDFIAKNSPLDIPDSSYSSPVQGMSN
jgi:hypothetical protein